MMHKLLASPLLALAIVATAAVASLDGASHGSLVHSHHRMIKRVATADGSDALEKRSDCGSGKGDSTWGSSGSWSHERAGEEHSAGSHHKHHHKHHDHHHHKHHHHHHHHHHTHHAAKDEGKETAATATHSHSGQKPEQKKGTKTDATAVQPKKEAPKKQEAPKQEVPKKEAPKQHKDQGHSSSAGELLDITFDGQCPHPKATEKHPNGCIEFLNCNIDSAGWSPPHVKIEHLKIKDADEVVRGDVFKPCAKYLGMFKSVAAEFNIHATILMSIAMQESHCDAALTGPNGEISLMQITPENCRGNCWDVYNNIRLGAIELDMHIKHHDGNFLLAAGEYNGWSKGMTTGEVKKEKWGCFAQQNLDYLNQLVNGWLRGLDGYSHEFLVYNNLGHCK